MKTKKLSPGELVIARFTAAGYSTRMIASVVGRDHSRIVRLTKPPPEGTGGQIPPAIQRALLAKAPRLGVVLTAEELILGGRA
jgi:hypothetical protein